MHVTKQRANYVKHTASFKATARLTFMLRAYNDKDIIDRVASLPSFRGWADGWYEIWIRENRTPANYDRFCDKAYTYEVIGGVPIFRMVRMGTSTAGSFGLQNFATYNSRGCAVLKSDQMVYGSHAYGLHKGKKPAYRQVKGFPYFRDNDKDKRAEEIGVEYNEPIGANIHRAGPMSMFIRNWSVACLVTQAESAFLKWLNMLVAAGKPLLNVAILKQF